MMITEADLRTVLAQELRTGFGISVYPNTTAARFVDHVVQRVREMQGGGNYSRESWRKNPPPPGPNPVYVKPGCDCGAERVNPTAKHAGWCSLLSPPRRH